MTYAQLAKAPARAVELRPLLVSAQAAPAASTLAWPLAAVVFVVLAQEAQVPGQALLAGAVQRCALPEAAAAVDAEYPAAVPAAGVQVLARRLDAQHAAPHGCPARRLRRSVRQ